MKEIARYGAKSPIPSKGFDRNMDGFAFSVYSPPELESPLHVTLQILKDAIDGVGGIVVGDHRLKEVFFVIETGPDHVFRGYGHFVAKRPGANA